MIIQQYKPCSSYSCSSGCSGVVRPLGYLSFPPCNSVLSLALPSKWKRENFCRTLPKGVPRSLHSQEEVGRGCGRQACKLREWIGGRKGLECKEWSDARGGGGQMGGAMLKRLSLIWWPRNLAPNSPCQVDVVSTDFLPGLPPSKGSWGQMRLSIDGTTHHCVVSTVPTCLG